jgi:carboxymethylenebutenolidase
MTGQMVRYGEDHARTGYLALPQAGEGPTVLVLHAWWGLNDFFKSLCDRFAEQGFTAFAPDLSNGKVAETIDDAAHYMENRDYADTEAAAFDAVKYALVQLHAEPAKLGVVGFSMGAAWAALLATLRPDVVRAVVMFYGTQLADFGGADAAFLCHFADEDEWEPREGIEAMRKALDEAGRPATFEFYTGAGHWFFEANRPDAYRPEAAELAWQRTLAFLSEQLGHGGEPAGQPRQG